MITLTAGCTAEPNGSAIDASTPEPDADPPGCQSNAECTDPAAPLCAPDGACVACVTNADCTDATAPTCDATTRACRACAVGADCTTGICDEDAGACRPESVIFFVDDDADCAAGDGTLAQPFCTIEEANAAWAADMREYVHVFAGSYDFPTVQPESPMYSGDAQAILRPQVDGVCFRVANNTSATMFGFRMEGCENGVFIEAPTQGVLWKDLTISGGDRAVFVFGGGVRLVRARIEGVNQAVRCETGATCQVEDSELTFTTGSAVIALDGSTLEVERTRIADIGLVGVVTYASTLELRDSIVEHTGLEAMDHGVSCNGPSCVIQRSRIRSATGAGIYIQTVDNWVIENNAIVENGTVMAGEEVNGGVVIDHIGLHNFTNNTVYGNKAGPGEVAGVRCLGGTTLANSILWGNGEGDQVNSGCIPTSSAIDQDTDPLYSNFRMDPMITNTTPGLIDEHLLPESPCIDRANASAAVDDIDGEPRAGVPDVGADERTP